MTDGENEPKSVSSLGPPQDPQLAWDAWKVEHENGRRAHDEHEAYGLEHFKAAVAFGIEAIRTSALINGGALVASLALIGATAQNSPQLAPHLIAAVRSFAFGVLCAGGASAAAYLAQYCFSTGHHHVTRNWEHPYVKAKPSGRKWDWTGAFFQVVAMGAVVSSYSAVLYGANIIYRAWMPHG